MGCFLWRSIVGVDIACRSNLSVRMFKLKLRPGMQRDELRAASGLERQMRFLAISVAMDWGWQCFFHAVPLCLALCGVAPWIKPPEEKG